MRSTRRRRFRSENNLWWSTDDKGNKTMEGHFAWRHGR
jgi:hypothetical protein